MLALTAFKSSKTQLTTGDLLSGLAAAEHPNSFGIFPAQLHFASLLNAPHTNRALPKSQVYSSALQITMR